MTLHPFAIEETALFPFDFQPGGPEAIDSPMDGRISFPPPFGPTIDIEPDVPDEGQRIRRVTITHGGPSNEPRIQVHAEPVTRRNLVLAQDSATAHRLVAAFALDPKRWRAAGYEDDWKAETFEKVVVAGDWRLIADATMRLLFDLALSSSTKVTFL